MEFKGKIIFFVKDDVGCIHMYKKNSKGTALLEQYLEYIELLEKELKHRLLKSFVVSCVPDLKYVWSSLVWRTDLNESVSPNHQKYITFLEDNRDDVKFIGPYKSMRTKSLHLCYRGHEWKIQPLKVKQGESCPNCKKTYRESNGAKLITEILVSNKIEFIKEVPLTRFGHERELRLDFLICQNNYPLFAIEFNGVQHFKTMKSDFFGGYEGSRKRKSRDRIKRNYCWKIGLPIIDIPYNDTDQQIEETVIYFLSLFELIEYEELKIS